MVIGGREAIGPVGGKGVEQLSDAIRLLEIDFARLGDDLLISGYVDVHRDS
jgi:diaminohydroxyphosphoribosylaminopyrimidine deaminase/5-amino-6-(5-phosphoribosylamino)uracil reductase